MKERLVPTFMKALRIALAAALLGAGISFVLAWSDLAPFYLALTASFMVLSFFFGFGLLVLLIFWELKGGLR